jgi:hypothetical protein
VSAFDYAAAHEFIQSGRHGLLSPIGNENTFIANAVLLARESALRARLATAAPSAVRNRSWTAIVDRFENDLLEAIAGYRGQTDPVGPIKSEIAVLKSKTPSRP